MTTIAPPFPATRQDIAGVAVADLAARYGTPTYVYDTALIDQRIADLKAFDTIRYAQKACNNIAILDRMRKQGVVVDAVTSGEVQRALAAGFAPHGDPHPIVYTADLLDAQGLETIRRYGLHVNCGSPDMVAQLAQAIPGCNVTLRVNPGFG
ncbi:MAG: diaminopimelate decarboxylase, partial [Pirellulaceae bacterium]